jgi:predicted dehydrogenase
VERATSARPTLRGAIVGFGTAAQAHLAGYAQREDVAIVAVVDPSAERRAAARATLPSVTVHATLDELAGAGPPDFLDVCCPPRWHAEAIVAGLELGCHVMGEKPLLPTLDEYAPVLAALDRAPGVLFPSHNYKFAPVVRRMRAAVMSEAFGDVVSGRFRTLRMRHAAGAPGWYPDWRRDPSVAGGGILQDHGTHAVYLATHVTGLAPLWVTCVTTRHGSPTSGGAEDSALLTLGLDGGADVTVELTWAAPSRQTSYTIVGTRESVAIDDVRFVHRASPGPVETAPAAGFADASHVAWFSAMFDDFRDLIDDPARQGALLDEAHATATVIASAYASAARGGERVDVAASAGGGGAR